MQLIDNVDANWDSYLRTTSTDWTKSTVLDTTIVAGSGNPRTCKATAGRVRVCNAAYGNTGWLGVASIRITGGTHITRGTVKPNDTYFSTAQYNTPAYRNLVSCQEVGHTSGLAHQDENFTNPTWAPAWTTNDPSTNQHPNQHDYDELVTIYSHLDSTTTVGLAVGQTNVDRSQVRNDASTWGARLEGSRAVDTPHTYVTAAAVRRSSHSSPGPKHPRRWSAAIRLATTASSSSRWPTHGATSGAHRGPLKNPGPIRTHWWCGAA